VTSLEANVCD